MLFAVGIRAVQRRHKAITYFRLHPQPFYLLLQLMAVGPFPPRTSISFALQEQHSESAGISAAPGPPVDTRDMNLRNYSWCVDAVAAEEHVIIS
jgi:hypothetical protein